MEFIGISVMSINLGCDLDHRLKPLINQAVLSGTELLHCSSGGLIRNHTSCPAFPNAGFCMAFSSEIEPQAPWHS